MNTADLTYLLNKPEAISQTQTQALDTVLQEFPYFQSVRALYLKGLFNQESFRYNYELKKTAVHTYDRTVLFDFITSECFTVLQKNNIEARQNFIHNLTVSESEIIVVSTEEENQDTVIEVETSNPVDDFSAEIIVQNEPFVFEKNEQHSFSEWLNLTKNVSFSESSDLEKAKKSTKIHSENDVDRIKKMDLIDKFIENNPKIPSAKETSGTPANIGKIVVEPTHLMTETLARIYLEQKKYQRAIQAYEILILKYPEKSSYFANQIEQVKKIHQNNN